MLHLGDFPVNGKVFWLWNSFAASGASVTYTAGTLALYKGNLTAATWITQRTSLAGVTQTKDFDGATGVHGVAIDLSDNTDAGFYAAGNEYQAVETGAVVDGQTVNVVHASWSIERAGGTLALIKAGVNATQIGGVVPANATIGTVTTVTDLTTTANAEPAAVPAANATLASKIAWMFALARNKILQTATTQTLKADDGATTIASASIGDDGTTFTRGKFA